MFLGNLEPVSLYNLVHALLAACFGFLPEYLPEQIALPLESIIIHLKYLLPTSSS